jgi:hypothetical protein
LPGLPAAWFLLRLIEIRARRDSSLYSLQLQTKEVRFRGTVMKKFDMLDSQSFSAPFFRSRHRLAICPTLPNWSKNRERSVVNISTTQVIKGRRGGHRLQFEGDEEAAQEFLRRFFPGQIPNVPRGSTRIQEPLAGFRIHHQRRRLIS